MEQNRKGYLYLLAGVAALGGFLFGFDIAIITGAMPFFEKHFSLTSLELGAVNSSLLFGCIVGSAVSGWVTDRYGRKKIMLLVSLLFAATSVACGLAPTALILAASRFVGGLAVGAISVLSPMYIAEIAPASVRGRFTSLYQLSITIGIVLSYFIGGGLPALGFRGIGGRMSPGGGQSGSATSSFSPVFSMDLIIFSLTFPIVIALLAGFYPARRASKMNIVTALKYE